MAETILLITFAGMTLVTYLPRLLPAWLLRERTLPPFLIAWLRYIPVAVLAALLLPSLVVQENTINISAQNLYLWAALPAGWVAWKKKSLFGTVITGMLIIALVRWLWK